MEEREDVVYTITSGNLEHNNWRCWAWFYTLEEAQRTIENCGDFFWEHYYDHVVIEEVPRGCVYQKYAEWWYKWNLDGEMWVPTDKPEAVDTVFHFGIG